MTHVDPDLAAYVLRVARSIELPPLDAARRAALRARVLGPDPASAPVHEADPDEVQDDAIAVFP